MTLPPYYSRLAPFEDAFRRGQPILTYHHVGPRRRGVRLKGLYVSPRLFARQMAELRAAGFTTPPYAEVLRADPGQRRQVFLTFDDGFRDVWEHALPALESVHFRALVFLVADLLGRTNEWQQHAGDVVEPLMDAGQVRDWLAAGHEIGAHTLTHPRLTQLPLPLAREEITASRKKLEDAFGRPVRHFCYPYGDHSAAVRALVEEAGYETACTTEPGINQPDTPPHALKRVTARYPSRNWRTVLAWLRLRRLKPGALCLP